MGSDVYLGVFFNNKNPNYPLQKTAKFFNFSAQSIPQPKFKIAEFIRFWEKNITLILVGFS